MILSYRKNEDELMAYINCNIVNSHIRASVRLSSHSSHTRIMRELSLHAGLEMAVYRVKVAFVNLKVCEYVIRQKRTNWKQGGICCNSCS